MTWNVLYYSSPEKRFVIYSSRTKPIESYNGGKRQKFDTDVEHFPEVRTSRKTCFAFSWCLRLNILISTVYRLAHLVQLLLLHHLADGKRFRTFRSRAYKVRMTFVAEWKRLSRFFSAKPVFEFLRSPKLLRIMPPEIQSLHQNFSLIQQVSSMAWAVWKTVVN